MYIFTFKFHDVTHANLPKTFVNNIDKKNLIDKVTFLFLERKYGDAPRR